VSGRPGGFAVTLVAALRAGLPVIGVVALIAGLAGLAWALSEQPTFSAEATVVVVDRGEAPEAIGTGVVAADSAKQRKRLLAVASSDDVAELAAASLGDDLSGVDLLAQTGFDLDRGGVLTVRSTAEFPDFASGAANAFAGAVVETGTLLERRRLQNASEGIQERLAEIDPASSRAERLTERLAAVDELAELGPPLRSGEPAQLPDAPSSGRSPAAASAAGALGGALVASLLLLGRQLIRRPIRDAERLAKLTGGPPLGAIGPRGPAVTSPEPAAVAIDDLGADRAQALLTTLGIDGRDGPGAVAVCSAAPGDGRTTVAVALAAAAARRGSRVLLMGSDLRSPRLAEIFELGSGPGLAEYLDGDAGPRDVINPIAVHDPAGERPPSSFVFVGAGAPHRAPTELLAGPRFGDLTDQLTRVYDLVLFDTPPVNAAADAAIVGAGVDGVLFCARAGRSTEADVRRAVGSLADSKLLGVVLLGARHRGPGLARVGRREDGARARQGGEQRRAAPR